MKPTTRVEVSVGQRLVLVVWQNDPRHVSARLKFLPVETAHVVGDADDGTRASLERLRQRIEVAPPDLRKWLFQTQGVPEVLRSQLTSKSICVINVLAMLPDAKPIASGVTARISQF